MAGIQHTSQGTILTQAEYEGTDSHTGLTAQRAAASGNLTLTGSSQDVPGATLTLVAQGTYVVWGVFDFTGHASDVLGLGELYVNGAGQSSVATCDLPTVGRASVVQVWLATTTGSSQIVKLRAYKTAGSGTSFVNQTHTTITALRIT